LQLEEEKADELVAYCCCRCRKRAISHCPHLDDNTNSEPEINKQNIALPSELTILSGKETPALQDQNLLVASFGTVKQVGEEILNGDSKTNMASSTQGGKAEEHLKRS
jgi:hypothetical protein